MTNASFLRFYNGAFQEALERVEIPGLDGASWDRRAAYLLWLATEQGKTFSPPAAKPPDTRSIFD